MACSPSGRFMTVNLIVTPVPLLAGEITAVPTLCPFASFNWTVTGFSAALRAVAMANVAKQNRIRGVCMDNRVSRRSQETGARSQEPGARSQNVRGQRARARLRNQREA